MIEVPGAPPNARGPHTCSGTRFPPDCRAAFRVPFADKVTNRPVTRKNKYVIPGRPFKLRHDYKSLLRVLRKRKAKFQIISYSNDEPSYGVDPDVRSVELGLIISSRIYSLSFQQWEKSFRLWLVPVTLKE